MGVETFADYILSEKDWIKKMEIVFYLQKRTGIFYDNTVIFKTLLTKLFIDRVDLGIDKNESKNFRRNLMRKLKKLVALALGFTCLASTAATATACGSNGGLTKSPDVLNISIFNGGYGTQYLRSVADAFEAEYPEITVKFEETKLFSEIQAQVEAGRYVADLIVTTSSYSSYGLKGHMVEISDVYDSYAYGEEGMPGAKKIVDKLGEAADVNHVEGYYYQMPVYLGTTGLIYRIFGHDGAYL